MLQVFWEECIIAPRGRDSQGEGNQKRRVMGNIERRGLSEERCNLSQYCRDDSLTRG